MDQIVSANTSLRAIDETHCRSLIASLRNQEYNYARPLTIVLFCATASAEDATHATAMQNKDRMKLPNGGHTMATVKKGHQRCGVYIYREGDLKLATEPLRIRFAFLADGKLILQAPAMKLSRIANISTAIERHKPRSWTHGKLLRSYTLASV